MADEKRLRNTPAVIAEWEAQPGGIGNSLARNATEWLQSEKVRIEEEERKRISDSPTFDPPMTE